MKANGILETYKSLVNMANGRTSIKYMANLLGCTETALAEMLCGNGLMKADGKPSELVTSDEIVGCVLLWLSMRRRG